MFVYRASCLEELLVTVEPWVSVEEVAAHLGVTSNSVYRWIGNRHRVVNRVDTRCGVHTVRTTENTEA